MRLLLYGFALLATLSLLLSGPAVAKDPDPMEDLVDKIKELRKAEDAGGLATALAEAPELYKASESKSARSKLLGEIGKVARDDDLGEARMAALEALVAIEDPKEAWKEIRRLMPDRKADEDEVTEFDLLVVKTAGQLAPKRGVKPLLELAMKAKHDGLAEAAVLALGGYKDDEKQRVTILEELIDVGKRTRPGQSTEKQTSPEAQERWAKIGPAITKALNALTGQKLTSFEDWEVIYDEYKRRPKDLFGD